MIKLTSRSLEEYGKLRNIYAHVQHQIESTEELFQSNDGQPSQTRESILSGGRLKSEYICNVETAKITHDMLFMELVGILRKPDKFFWRRIIITEAITGNIECFLRGTILSGSYHLSTQLSHTALRWLLFLPCFTDKETEHRTYEQFAKVTQLVSGGTEIQTHSVPNAMPLTSM